MSKNDYLPTDARCHILNDEASIYMSNNWTNLTLEEQEAVVAYEAKCQARTPSLVMGIMGAGGGYLFATERMTTTPLNQGIGALLGGAVSYYVTQYLVQMYVRHRLLKLHPYITGREGQELPTGGMQTCAEGRVWDPVLKECGPLAGQKANE